MTEGTQSRTSFRLHQVRAIADFLEQRHQSFRQHYEFMVTVEGDRAGFCGLNIESQEFKRASIAYGYLPKVWGNGIGTEAADRLMQFGFDRLGLVRIQATAHPDNIASHRVAEHIGMKYEGRLSKYAFAHNEWRDSLLFACTIDD